MLGLFSPIKNRQPATPPQIDWGNPINVGLVGCLWVGPGGPFDLVDRSYTSLVKGGHTFRTTKEGISSDISGAAASGISTGRNTYGKWKITSLPITFLVYGGFPAAATSRTVFGVVGGSNAGYSVFNLFSTGSHRTQVSTGAAISAAESGGTWTRTENIKGMTIETGTNGHRSYDNGVQVATANVTGGATIDYDAGFGHMMFGGDVSTDFPSSASSGYWQALWSRVLSANEVKSLNANPWQMFLQPDEFFPMFVPSGGAAFAARLPWMSQINNIKGIDSIKF